jgi:hypothetical protein
MPWKQCLPLMLLATALGLVIGPFTDRYEYRRTLLVCGRAYELLITK